MNRIITVSITALLILIGCKKDNNPVSTSNLTEQGAFVIDTLKLNAFVRSDTLLIPVHVAYRFSGKSGSFTEFSMKTDSLSLSIFMDPGAPTPTGNEQLFSYEFKAARLFLNRDSIFVRVSFGGAFWERTDSTIQNYGTFSINDSTWLQVQK